MTNKLIPATHTDSSDISRNIEATDTTGSNDSSRSNIEAATPTTATTTGSNNTPTKRKSITLPPALAYLAEPNFDTVTVPAHFFHPIIMFETISVARLVWYIFSQNHSGVEYVEASYTELERELNLSRSAIHQAINRATARGYINRSDSGTGIGMARSRFSLNWPGAAGDDGSDSTSSGTTECEKSLPFGVGGSEDGSEGYTGAGSEEEEVVVVAGEGEGTDSYNHESETTGDGDTYEPLPFATATTTTLPSHTPTTTNTTAITATSSLDPEHQLLTPHQARALAISLARKAEEAIATDMTADYLESVPPPAAVTPITSTSVVTTTNITSITYQLPDQNQNHTENSQHQLDGTDPAPSYQYDQNFDGPAAANRRPGQHFDTDYQRPTYSPQPKGKGTY